MSYPVDRHDQAWTPEQAAVAPPSIHPASEAARIERALTPATAQEADDVLQILFRLMPLANRGDTDAELDEHARLQHAAYRHAVRGMPKWAIIETRDAFIAGTVPDQGRVFAPKSPEFGYEVSRRVEGLRAKLARMRRRAEEARAFENNASAGRLSDEMRALGAARVAELRALSRADRVRRGPSPARDRPVDTEPASRPLTAEDLADVPDAPRRTGPMAKLAPPAFAPLSGRGR